MSNDNKTIFSDEIFERGCAFLDCGFMCHKMQENTNPLYFRDPMVVNYSFACEVFLKAMLYNNEIKVKKKHGLKDLFEQLPSDLQELIQERTVDWCGQWNDAFGLPLLREISDAFVIWRYSFENDFSRSASKSIRIGFLTGFSNALRETCCECLFKMTWEQYMDQRRGVR